MIGKLGRLEVEVMYLRKIEELVRTMLDADRQRRQSFELAEEYNREEDWAAEADADTRFRDALRICDQILDGLDRAREGVNSP